MQTNLVPVLLLANSNQPYQLNLTTLSKQTLESFLSRKMKLLATGCVFLAYVLHVLGTRQKYCSFYAHERHEDHSPIILQNQTSLLLPVNGRIELKSTETVTLLCPGQENYITSTGKNVSEAWCVFGSILRLDNFTVLEFDHIQCKEIIRGSVFNTSKECGGDRGRIYKIGYPVTRGNFISLIDICYNYINGSALYSAHLLHGKEINYDSNNHYVPSFSPEALAPGVSAFEAYDPSYQNSTFSRILKSRKLAAYLIQYSFLYHVKLSPDADFLLASWKYTTYYYINTVPQWIIINMSNWWRIEIAIRKLAGDLRETLEIFTGTHGVLKLADIKGQARKIYLMSESKLPVPKFLWKAVYSKRSKKAVVLVNLNNPFVSGIEEDLLCENVCEENGWGDVNWNDYQRGFVYCCDYREFADAVGTAPELSVVGVLNASLAGCSFPAHGQHERKSPILLQNQTSLLLPANGTIVLKPNETVTLLCPDAKNYITSNHEKVSEARCVNENILQLDTGEDLEFDDIQCKKIIRGSVLKTSEKCGGDRGRIYKIGYPVTTGNFISLIDICYNKCKGSTLYSEHLLHGEEIKSEYAGGDWRMSKAKARLNTNIFVDASKNSYRPRFSPEALGPGVSASAAYNQTYQKSNFSKILNSSKLAEYYINRKSFLARGHLSPAADFLFASWQYTTYYYINTVPQWQIINTSNWKKIENAIRKLAVGLRETLVIYTGTHGVLELADVNKTARKIYLVSGSKLRVPKLPVPKFLWKVVYSKRSKKAVVFVNLNNPFVSESEKDFLCENVCKVYGWGDASWNDYQRGFVYCCDYREFADAVGTAPKLSVEGVLSLAGCSFSAHGQHERKSPILLQNQTSLLLPANGTIVLKSMETVTLLCPDEENYITSTGKNVSEARCVSGNILQLDNGEDIEFDDVQCEKIIRGSVLKSSEECGGDRGRIYKIGYPVTMGNFISLIDICYDEGNESALYSSHLLHGKEINYASKNNYRPRFSTEALGPGVSASVAYSQTYQKSTFSKIFNSSELADYDVYQDRFLFHGQLSPDADFLFASWQFTTYYYINTVPQWQKINTSNWKRIENAIRKLAGGLRETLVIYTGTHGVLDLAIVHGEAKEIYLVSESKLPVPKFVWKAVYSKRSKKAVVFVNLNNPFVSGIEKDLLCVDVCKENGWGDANWNDSQSGFVYCCDYREFVLKVRTAPELSVVGVLQGLK